MQELRSVILSACVGVLCSAAHPVVARAQQSEPMLWATVGAGAIRNGLASAASASHLASPGLFGVRRTETTSLPLQLFSCWSEDIVEWALLYGQGKRTRRRWRSYSSGIAFVNRVHTRSDCVTRETGPIIGLPLEVTVMWTPERSFGVSLTTFANLNSASSFAGGLVSLSLGRVRPH
jgi:hypothetical protein